MRFWKGAQSPAQGGLSTVDWILMNCRQTGLPVGHFLDCRDQQVDLASPWWDAPQFAGLVRAQQRRAPQ